MSHYMTAIAMRQTGISPEAKIALYWLAEGFDSIKGEGRINLVKLHELAGCSNAALELVKRQLTTLGILQIKAYEADFGMVYTLDGLQFNGGKA
jgi:hypothetical protein